MQNKDDKDGVFLTDSSEEECKKLFDIVTNIKPDVVEEADIDELDKLVRSHPEWLKVQSTVPVPIQNSSDIHSRDAKSENESACTPLEIAILNHAQPEVVDALLLGGDLSHKTSKGRTARECAELMTNGEELTDESSVDVKNAFAAIELIDANLNSTLRVTKLRQTVKLAESMLVSLEEGADLDVDKEFDAKSKWMKIKTTLKFAGTLMLKHSNLGPKVESDSHPAVRPAGFKLPQNLDKVTLDIELPAGFKRLRKALLKSTSSFLLDQYYTEKMGNKDVKLEKWNKHDDHIGCHNNEIDQKDFPGAKTKLQYLMPKSLMVSANTAYETITITEYNNHCFTVQKITKNPDVPYGKKFETHTQWVLVNNGCYKCRMICSTSAVFPKGKPAMVAWKIKSGMLSGCTDAHVKLAETIVAHAGNEKGK